MEPSLRRFLPLLAAALLFACCGARVLAFGPEAGDAASDVAFDKGEVAVTERVGNGLPLDLKFVDQTGHPVRLGQYFKAGRPVVLQLGYYGCPMLCELVSQGTVNALKAVSLAPGKDYEFVFVSIDPSETPALAAAKADSYLQAYGRGDAAGWHFLTGTQESIAPLAQAVGFHYKWIGEAGRFAHPAVIMMCTPDGRVSRYLYGVKFDPKDVRNALVEASLAHGGKAVSEPDLICFRYDGRQGKYATAALDIMRTGGVLIMIVLSVWLIRTFRREALERARRPGGPDADA